MHSTVRNIKILNCSQRGCVIDSAVIEDCIVDGFDTRGQLLRCWGAVFKHVVLRGKIGKLMTSSIVELFKERPQKQAAFDAANEAYYRNVDWALDISGAEFQSFDIRGNVPARLIRRDPETQVVVTREKALNVPWKDLPLNEMLWKVSLELILSQGLPDKVLVAPKRNPRFKELVADLRTLQAAGVAEPD